MILCHKRIKSSLKGVNKKKTSVSSLFEIKFTNLFQKHALNQY